MVPEPTRVFYSGSAALHRAGIFFASYNPNCPSYGDPHRDVTYYPPYHDNANAPFYPTHAHAALTAGTVKRPRPTSDTRICHQSHYRHKT